MGTTRLVPFLSPPTVACFVAGTSAAAGFVDFFWPLYRARRAKTEERERRPTPGTSSLLRAIYECERENCQQEGQVDRFIKLVLSTSIHSPFHPA